MQSTIARHAPPKKHKNINSQRPRPNIRPFADDIFKRIFENENEYISPGISPSRRQAIIWTYGGQFNDAYMRHSASMS